MSISLDHLKEAVAIHEQIAALEARLEKILTGDGHLPLPFSLIVKKGRKKMSAAARAKIAEAQRARWAKQKGTSSPAKKGKRTISPAHRAKLRVMMKARWAARRKAGGPALNLKKKK